MNAYWKLKVEKLGKIDEAEIAVTPLTMFVGDNNSGKSYLMTLIYTLLNTHWIFERYDFCKETDEYLQCEKWIKEKCKWESNQENNIELTGDIQFLFQNLLNQIINRNLSRIARKGFNSDVEIGKVNIELIPNEKRKHVCFRRIHLDDRQIDNYAIRFISDDNPSGTATMGFSFVPKHDMIIYTILEYLLKGEIKKRDLYTDACYLPASRTGFLLNYRAIINASISDTYDQERSGVEGLTRPCSDFLKILAGLKADNQGKANEELIRFIEGELLHGDIRTLSDTPQSSFVYHSDETGHDYPMYLSSGVITELAPLMLLLKYWRFENLFIEEPEMSLHPKLQQLMARVLIRLCNQGYSLFVTTHSDTILQQVNNMIKLSNLEECKQEKMMKTFGYIKQDLLSGENISMYQFDVSDAGHTKITQLSYGPYGFEIPSFNSALSKLLDETYQFEGESEQ